MTYVSFSPTDQRRASWQTDSRANLQAWYRAHLRVSPLYAQTIRIPAGTDGQQRFLEDIRHRLGWLGMRDVRLITQDPTDPSLLTAIAAADDPAAQRTTDGVVRIEQMEPVETPPEPEPLAGDPELDDGLNRAEARTVRYALQNEANPRHLTGLAQTLEPWFPVAASRLRVRSALLEPGASFRPLAPRKVSDEELDRARAEVEQDAARNSFPMNLAKTDVRRAIVRLVQEPHVPNVGRTSAERAAALAVIPVAMRTDTRHTEVLRVADPMRVRRLLPFEPRDAFVSPTALKLALATTGKPEISGVAYRTLATPRASSIADGQVRGSADDRIELLQARHALDKAERCLERCRWVRLYDRWSTQNR